MQIWFTRLFLRLHCATWIALFILSGAWGLLQQVDSPGFPHGEYGFPFIAWSDSLMASPGYGMPFLPSGLAADLVFAGALLAGTAFCLENWLRRGGSGRQFTIRSLLILTTTICCLLAFWMALEPLFKMTRALGLRPNVGFLLLRLAGNLIPLLWLARLPILLATGCTLYAGGWLIARQCNRRLLGRSVH
ncbi:MAG TPA: hypothetical protein VGN42_26275 [Pirellulales bacterium]|jgi:hypothetical protein|nr:hypothetical protein [Pirellulales bacterium]